MQHHIPHCLDCVVATVTTLITASVPLLFAEAGPDADEMRLLLLPLIGAAIASGGMIMLNPNPETRRITIGRALFALLAGVVAPQLVALAHPSLAAVALKPILLVAGGAASSVIVYALSKPFANQLYARSERIAKAHADRLEKRIKAGGGTTKLD